MVAVAGPPLLLRGASLGWSLPAAAPLLGLAGLAGAFPAVAGMARRGWTRAALGALGLWWLLLAEPLLGRALLFGAASGTPPRPRWDGAAGLAASDVIAPLATSGAVAQALLWAGAALVMPWVVRGRNLAVDVVAATIWAAGLAAATLSVGQAAGGGSPRGLVAGAVLAGALAVALRRTEALREGHETEYL
jgi:eukaryotic-like serine/threonine-protein kinase